MIEFPLTGGGRTEVSRRGDVVLRAAAPWTWSVHAILRHLEQKGFAGAPHVVGDGFDDQGRETLTYIEGEFIHPASWSDEAVITVGQMLKSLHMAMRDFTPPDNATWRPWFGRSLRGSHMVYGHGDFAPWNLVCRNNLPIAAIDWENAGPVDALVELAHVAWLNVQLVDNDVANRVGLPPIQKRAEQLRLLVDAYELPRDLRSELIQTMIDVATLDAADQAIEGNITPDTTDPTQLWGLAWRTRSAAWMIRNRKILEKAI
jgi:Ser/Thr protein kinase RdoA (MazF antagonist)